MDIENFIAEFKKTFVYDILSQTLSDEQLFERVVDGDAVLWFKEQTRQMWLMWEKAKAQAVPEGFVLVEKAKIKTWYQDDDEPENFCYEADDFDVLGECLDHEDILRVNKIEDAIIQTTPMYGVWKFKIVGGQPERDCFVLCNTEEEAISIREEYRRMIDLEAREPAND